MTDMRDTWKCTKCGAEWKANATSCPDCAESAYPEHEKLHKAKEELGTEQIGAFLEWLQHEGIKLARHWDHESNCETFLGPVLLAYKGKNGRYFRHPKDRCPNEEDGRLADIFEPITKLLARYAGIDLEKLEDEKRQMLDEARRAHRKEG